LTVGTDLRPVTFVAVPREIAHVIESPESKYRPPTPYAVWVAGTYVGRDPDPNVRSTLMREFYRNYDDR
jgi:hypothetical protein